MGKTWCVLRQTYIDIVLNFSVQSGTGFATFYLPSPLNTVCLGICMDLNPQIDEWTSARGPYEIADYAVSKGADVVVLLNAWLDSQQEVGEVYDWQTLNYWAARTRPLWTDGQGDKVDLPEEPEEQESQEHGRETIVVVCNRSGSESGTIKMLCPIYVLLSDCAVQGRNSLAPRLSLVWYVALDDQSYWI